LARAARSDFRVALTPEVDVPHPLLSLDSITRNAEPAQPASVRSSTDRAADAAWVQLVGRLDLAAVPQLVRTLRQTQLKARLVVLDLRELRLMDPSCVHVIVNAGIRARRLGGRLVLLRIGQTRPPSSA
jgi:anti-anti-sigma factor